MPSMMLRRLWVVFFALALATGVAACACGDDDDDDDDDGAPIDDDTSDDDDDDDDVDDDADDDSFECPEEPTLMGDPIPEPPMSDEDFYASRCPDAADPGAYEDVTLTYVVAETASTATAGWQDGSVEAVRFRPEHPFHLKSIEFYFYNDCGETVARIVPDELGSVFDETGDLAEPVHMAVPEDWGWTEVPVRDWDIVAQAEQPFWVAYEHTAKAPYLGQDNVGNIEYSSVFWDEDWAAANSPWTHGQPQYNFLVRAKGHYFCKQDARWFTDVTADVSLGPDTHRQRTVWADINNDGWDDVIVSTGGYDEDGFSVFLNNDGVFTDVTDASGLNGFGAGVAVLADFDNDGNLDAYLGVNTPQDDPLEYHNTILLGDGLGAFTEVPSNGVDKIFDVTLYGEPVSHRPSHVAATALDFDEDGILDLYLGNWEIEYPYATSYPDLLMKGNGDGTFTDVSEDAGVYDVSNRPSYGVTASDYNNDGHIDIAVANYGGSLNTLFTSNGDGTFTDRGIESGFAVGANGHGGTSFGLDFGDIDNDGDLDAYQSNIQHPRYENQTGGSTLFKSTGSPDWNFTDFAPAAGIPLDEGEIDGSFADFDNDGRLDLFLSDLYSGHYGRLFKQNEDGTFSNATYESGIDMHDCTNHAWGDYDMDGDLDLLVTRRSGGQQVHLWENTIGQDNQWATFRLIGDGSTSSTTACGARVTLTAGDLTQIREVQCGRGHASAGPSHPVEFGLGGHSTIDTVTVDWPGGTSQTWNDPPTQRFIDLEQGEAGISYYDE